MSDGDNKETDNNSWTAWSSWAINKTYDCVLTVVSTTTTTIVKPLYDSGYVPHFFLDAVKDATTIDMLTNLTLYAGLSVIDPQAVAAGILYSTTVATGYAIVGYAVRKGVHVVTDYAVTKEYLSEDSAYYANLFGGAIGNGLKYGLNDYFQKSFLNYVEYASYTPQPTLFISANQAQSVILQHAWNNKIQTFRDLFNAGKYEIIKSFLDHVKTNKLNILKGTVNGFLYEALYNDIGKNITNNDYSNLQNKIWWIEVGSDIYVFSFIKAAINGDGVVHIATNTIKNIFTSRNFFTTATVPTVLTYAVFFQELNINPYLKPIVKAESVEQLTYRISHHQPKLSLKNESEVCEILSEEILDSQFMCFTKEIEAFNYSQKLLHKLTVNTVTDVDYTSIEHFDVCWA